MNAWLENKIRQGFETDNKAPLGTPDNPSSKVFTIANTITLMRLVLTIIFLFMFIEDVNRYLSVAIYALAACTDWMDGMIARRTRTVSWFGKLLDPVCDRCLLFCGVLGLVIIGELPVWVAVLVIGRDAYLAWGMMYVRKYRERPIDVVFIGKIATACLMFGFCDMLLGWPVLEGFNWVNGPWFPLLNSESGAFGLLFIYIGCIFSVLTAFLYTYEGLEIVKAVKAHDQKLVDNALKAKSKQISAAQSANESLPTQTPQPNSSTQKEEDIREA